MHANPNPFFIFLTQYCLVLNKSHNKLRDPSQKCLYFYVKNQNKTKCSVVIVLQLYTHTVTDVESLVCTEACSTSRICGQRGNYRVNSRFIIMVTYAGHLSCSGAGYAQDVIRKYIKGPPTDQSILWKMSSSFRLVYSVLVQEGLLLSS